MCGRGAGNKRAEAVVTAPSAILHSSSFFTLIKQYCTNTMSLNTAKTPQKEFTLDLGQVDIRQRWQTRPPKQFPSPWACEWGFDEYGLWQCFQVKGIKHKMRYIPPGEFWMGSPDDERERRNNETLHHVTLTEGFWLGETTVTQALWLAVMGSNPSGFEEKRDEYLPVENVSWFDCQGFMGKLKSINSFFVFTFPTEAQWEYACRAGTKTPFNTGEILTDKLANFQNSEHRTVDVHRYAANAWGLKQMHGNVWEWCANSLYQYPAEPQVDPVGGFDIDYFAVRGGSWYYLGSDCRSAYRYDYDRYEHYNSIGLRLAGF